MFRSRWARFAFVSRFLGSVALAAALACSDDSDDSPAAGAGGSAGAAGGAAGGSGGGAGAGGSGGGASGSGGAEPDAGADPFTLSSPAFANEPGCGPDDDAEACALFPADNTGLGGARDVSPALEFRGAPPDTASFAITLHDLTFLQSGDPFTHWAMWNIPGDVAGLPAELPRGSEPGVPSDDTRQVAFRNDDGYAGSGACGNVYEFVLYALDTPSFEPPDLSGLDAFEAPDAVEEALEASDAVLATARLRARSNPEGPGCD